MPTEVKICGLADRKSLDAALDVGADFVGFVFFPRSPRNLTIDQAAPLISQARGRAKIVALLVEPDDQLLDDVVCTLDPDLLQLHGRESPERVASIASNAMTPIMKAVGVGEAGDLSLLDEYAEVADRLLLDAKPPKDATRPGGNAETFDWRILDGYEPPLPWMLAGGLDAANVAEAIAATGAPGVDVSTAVEIAPGQKDPALIRTFVETVRAFDAASAKRLAS